MRCVTQVCEVNIFDSLHFVEMKRKHSLFIHYASTATMINEFNTVIILANESWLNSNIKSNENFLDGYKIFEVE